MLVSLIVAAAENGVIGRNGDLPWRLSSDLRRFKSLTMGHHILMGRKTYESIGRPLPGRTSVVLTRQRDYAAPEGVRIVSDWQEAVQACQGDNEVFVIGGEEIYRLALPQADRIYLTRVHAEVAGDARFPDWKPEQWSELESVPTPADEKNELPTTFCVLQRRDAARESN